MEKDMNINSNTQQTREKLLSHPLPCAFLFPARHTTRCSWSFLAFSVFPSTIGRSSDGVESMKMPKK